MKKRTLPLSEVYRLLEPGPVVLLTTGSLDKANVMTMSWHTMMEFEPPLVGCVVSNRNKSFETLKRTKECVINIPSARLLQQTIGCGNVSGKSEDKFSAFGLTPVPASEVSPPLVSECYANLECRVADARMVERYCFFVLEVVKAWINPKEKDARTIHHRGKGLFMIAGKSVRTRSKAA